MMSLGQASGPGRAASPLAAFAIAAGIALLVLAASWNSLGQFVYDSGWYDKMASQGLSQVEKPYANRLVAPFLAGTVSRVAGLDVHEGFFLVSLFGLFLLAAAVVFILRAETGRAILALPLLFTPYLLDLFQKSSLPDLFHAGLLGLFFWTLLRQKAWPFSFALLVLLLLTRESTVLVGLFVVLAAFLKSRKSAAWTALAATIVGLILSAALTRSALPNVHHLGSFLYMALKIPSNLFLNLLGFKVWLNTLTDAGQPLFQLAVPAWLHLGAVTRIGLCAWEPSYVLRTWLAWLTTFGIAPTFLFFSLLKHRFAALRRGSFWLTAVVLYGLASFVLGPFLGPGVPRLVGYGWPAFWLGAPILLLTFYRVPRPVAVALLSLHVALSWISIFLPPPERESLPLLAAAVLAAAVLQILAWRTFRRLEPVLDSLARPI